MKDTLDQLDVIEKLLRYLDYLRMEIIGQEKEH